MARIQEAYWYYQTQGGNHALGHVLSYADLPRVEHHQEIINWHTVTRKQRSIQGMLIRHRSAPTNFINCAFPLTT